MLKIASKHYLKSIGDESFVPNPSSSEFHSANCLDVVIERKPRFFWQRPIYTYDNFGLNDLLDIPLPQDKSQYLKNPEKLASNYTNTNTHSARGKFGTKIASLLTLDVAADDVLSFSIDLQDIEKQSIDFSAVQNMLKSKKVNLQSKYLKRLAQDKYNVVCLITQYIYVNKPTTITVTITKDFSETGDIVESKFDIDNSGTYHRENKKVITLDPGTRLAFEFSECLISDDGSIELLDRSDSIAKVPMIPRAKPKVQLPNYCSHIMDELQSFDIPDSSEADNLVDLLKNLSDFSNKVSTLDLKKHLLSLALNDANILNKLELFLLYCLQEKSDCEREINSLELFDRDMLTNVHLKYVLEFIKIDIKGSTTRFQASSLSQDLLRTILSLIHALYHLEKPHLENLQYLVSTNSQVEIEQLKTFLQTVKFKGVHDTAMCKQLSKSATMKHLLRTVGVNESDSELNEYFEPVLVFLYS